MTTEYGRKFCEKRYVGLAIEDFHVRRLVDKIKRNSMDSSSCGSSDVRLCERLQDCALQGTIATQISPYPTFPPVANRVELKLILFVL